MILPSENENRYKMIVGIGCGQSLCELNCTANFINDVKRAGKKGGLMSRSDGKGISGQDAVDIGFYLIRNIDVVILLPERPVENVTGDIRLTFFTDGFFK